MVESTAAALGYGLVNAGSKTVMVFDMGGGTTDISVTGVSDSGTCTVEAVAGHGQVLSSTNTCGLRGNNCYGCCVIVIVVAGGVCSAVGGTWTRCYWMLCYRPLIRTACSENFTSPQQTERAPSCKEEWVAREVGSRGAQQRGRCRHV
jgi:hypothetical protein